MNEKILKAIGIFGIIVVILDLTLFVSGKITTRLFWVVIILVAIYAYYASPYLKEKALTK